MYDRICKANVMKQNETILGEKHERDCNYAKVCHRDLAIVAIGKPETNDISVRFKPCSSDKTVPAAHI